MIPVWFSLTLKFMAIALVAVSVGLWLGVTAGWATACAGLALLHAVHVYHLARMERWLNNPSADTLPDPWGTWGLIFAGVYRALRLEAKKRDAVDKELELFTRAEESDRPTYIAMVAEYLAAWLAGPFEQPGSGIPPA